MQMPFGKYRGAEVEDIPYEYLEWMCANITLREPLLSEVGRVLFGNSREMMVLKPDRIKNVYRELSLKYHPDHGGDNLAQCAVNEFYERLMKA